MGDKTAVRRRTITRRGQVCLIVRDSGGDRLGGGRREALVAAAIVAVGGVARGAVRGRVHGVLRLARNDPIAGVIGQKE